jgi:hypothetical protein
MKLLERNDLVGAKKFYEENSPITSSQAEMLIHMQDDPTDLLALMKKESWKIGGVGGRRT